MNTDMVYIEWHDSKQTENVHRSINAYPRAQALRIVEQNNDCKKMVWRIAEINEEEDRKD